MGEPPNGVWDCAAGVAKPVKGVTAGLALMGARLGVARRVRKGTGVLAAPCMASGAACAGPVSAIHMIRGWLVCSCDGLPLHDEDFKGMEFVSGIQG